MARETTQRQGILVTVPLDQGGKDPRIVTETNPFPIGLFDGKGNPLSSFYDASTDSYVLDVHHADVHHNIVDDYVHRHTDQSTLSVAASAGDHQITLVSAADFIVGEYVHLGDIPSTTEPVHPEIVGKLSNVLTLDRPIDNSYPIGANVSQSVIDLTTGTDAASIASPVVSRFAAQAGSVVHITRLLFDMTHATAPDDSKFGGILRLTNGVVIRTHIDGITRTLSNWKDNGDIKLDMYDVEYTDKAGGGLHGTSGRESFDSVEVAIRLDADRGDYVEVLVQDDLTNLSSFKVKLQGHIEGS